ncbi:MAG: CHASE domain-containing protein [Candidatus Didemnitutus sp.]|nr:CHASE domain-containing protein [Candidatus Didemnitutus sp.]
MALLGLLLSLLFGGFVRQSEEERLIASFQRRAEAQTRIIRERIRLYEEMTHNLRSLFLGAQGISRLEFERACADLLERHPAVQALEWVAYVRDTERDAFVADARREYADFTVHEPDGQGGFKPAARHPDHTIIRLVAPLASNEAALGYDNSRSPIGSILATARRERRFVVTQQFRLAQAAGPGTELGVVFASPLFAPDPAPGSDGFLGFAQYVFRVNTMLSEPHRVRPSDALLVYYTDLDALGPANAILYTNRVGDDSWPAPSRLGVAPQYTFREIINLGGRRWEVFIEMSPVWRKAQLTSLPLLALLGGLVSTGIFVLLLQVVLRRTVDIEKQVARRTAELEQAKAELEDDIERRHAAEQALIASEKRLEAILDNSPAAIFVKDLDGRYTHVNPRFSQLCARPRAQIIGHRDAEIFPPEIAAVLEHNDRTVHADGCAREFEEIFTSHAGVSTSIVQRFPLRDPQGAIYSLCGVATDITERVHSERSRLEFERRLQQTQRFESLGVLAGGIAHDFNNILTSVLGNASLARLQLPSNSPINPQLHQIEQAARRAADLCTQMLAYAGKGNLIPAPICLSDLVRDTAALLEISVNKSTRLHLDLAPQLPSVQADATQLRQIVMNLIINAADAIGERAGEIHLRTYALDATAELLHRAVQAPELPAGHYVAVEVRDTGGGIAPDALVRIFEPFFTTKFVGRGLGLSAVLGIVRAHAGALFVETELGHGSTFRLLLPTNASAPRRDMEAIPQNASVRISDKPRLTGTVLVVDDELHVREITILALRTTGLKVVGATDGRHAVDLCADPAVVFDLVLLDLTMPNMSGEESFRVLRRDRPDLKVILMSGYSEQETAQRSLALGAVAFLPKPYEVEHMLELVTKHLPA